MRIFIPLSEVISMESTVDSSIMSINFFTYRRSIIAASAKFYQLSGEMREDCRAVRSEMHIVLDAHAAPIRPIDPRFDCHHCTFGERAFRSFRETRRFMHFQSQP